jgi:type VI secretion system secreted protein VgrG
MAVTQKNREIEITTPLGSNVLLVSDMHMTEELGRLFAIDLELLSTENIKFEDLIGQNVTIRLNLVGEKKRYFNGYVSSISQGLDEGRFAKYNATVHPWLWFLTRTTDCRIFQNKTVPEIIKEVFKDFDYGTFEDNTTATYRKCDYCVQYRETDFNFISRLMENEGIYYYHKHEDGKHILMLVDDPHIHENIPDYEKIPFYPPDSTALRDEEFISAWYLKKQLQPCVYALNDYDFTKPSADLQVTSKVSRQHNEAVHEIYDYPGVYLEGGQGLTYAKTRIEELQAQFEQAKGQGIARGLITGGLFTLTGYSREDQNREYLVVSVDHSIRCDSFEAGDDGSTSYSNIFTVIESKTPFRSQRITRKPIVQGPQTALVVGPKSEEIYTDEHGRVKLQFHWDRYGKKDENSSCWIRVSQVHAGKGFGGIDIPRIGEEVIVSFEEGDPDRPIVTGRVYNGSNKAPNGLPAKKMVSGLKSNSTPGSGGDNTIMLDDSKGKEQILIHGQYNMDTTVDNNQTTTVHNNRTDKIDVDDSETVGGNQTVHVVGSQKINIDTNRNETVGGTETIMITGHRTETVNGGETVTINGVRSHTVNGAQTTTISLAEMHSVGAGRMHNVGAAEAITVGGGQMVSVGAAQMVSVGGVQKVNVGALQSVTVGGPHKLSAAVISETSKGPYKIKAGATYLVEAPTIILKAGGSKIIMNSGGITIKGAKITIKSSGSGSFTASGSIKIKGSNLGED